MTACPSCSEGRDGFLVVSPEPFARETLGLSSTQASRLPGEEPARLLDARTAWLEERHFYGMLEFWDLYCQPRSWSFHKMPEPHDIPATLADSVSWDWILDHAPKVWIDELIRDNRIRMHFQPIVDVGRPGGLVGYELLARGVDQTGSLISPAVLIDEAKNQNRLFHLDRACRIQAIRTADGQSHPDALYFINFIPSVIYVAEHCLETTFKALKASRIPPERIIFEVTESEYVSDLDHLKSILRYYRSHGLRYALDDVGEGHNTLETLRFLEPDIVKLDRKWVTHVDREPEKQEVARETLDTARLVGAKALAEGVETEEEARVLKDMGYHWQQGYLYGKPSASPQTL